MKYRIDWRTEIFEEREGTLTRFPVRGFTIVEAEDQEDASAIAAELVDVDFFVPLKKYSASDDRVLSGAMWSGNPANPIAGHHSSLATLLPTYEEWNFESVDILSVTPAEEIQ